HRLGHRLVILVVVWVVAGTGYVLSHRGEGVLTGYAWVLGLVGAAFLAFSAFDLALGFLPLWLARCISLAVLVAILGVIVWHLRARIPVMAELFVTFVRRGQWYMLPLVAGLVSLGGLLVVAASSPWLAPFIYTLF